MHLEVGVTCANLGDLQGLSEVHIACDKRCVARCGYEKLLMCAIPLPRALQTKHCARSAAAGEVLCLPSGTRLRTLVVWRRIGLDQLQEAAVIVELSVA
eukprot:5288641-Prymnesium_polylepis.1